MFFKFTLLLVIVSVSSSFSQSISLTAVPEGSYTSYQEFLDKKPSVLVDSIKNNLIKNQYGNIIVLPARQFSKAWGIVLKDNLYIRRTSNMRSSVLPIAAIPLNGAVVTISKLDAAFVRILKYGSICLNAENDMLKLPSIENYRVSVSNFKYLIKTDKELTASYKKEQDKLISVYKYIDLYNDKHPITD